MPNQTTRHILLAAWALFVGCRDVERVVPLRDGSGPSPTTPGAGAYFGHAVSAHGDRAIVGAYGDAERAENAGAAYIFHKSESGWKEEAKLAPLNLGRSDQFGIAVDVHEDVALVGARGEIEGREPTGYAVFYRRFDDGWRESRTVISREPDAGDHFGLAVAVDAEWAAVGAYGDPTGGRDAGAVYLYRLEQGAWQFRNRLTAPDAAESDYFGFSVALEADRLVVGAFGDDDRGIRSGSAYVYRLTAGAWRLDGKLLAPDGAAHNLFGRSVALSGSVVVIGAHGHETRGRFSGAAYVFGPGSQGWSMVEKLVAPDGVANHYFGFSVSAASGRILVGARGEGPSQAGSAYLFAGSGTGYGLVAKLRADAAEPFDFFGHAVTLTDAWGLVGAHGRDGAGPMSGAVFGF